VYSMRRKGKGGVVTPISKDCKRGVQTIWDGTRGGLVRRCRRARGGGVGSNKGSRTWSENGQICRKRSKNTFFVRRSPYSRRREEEKGKPTSGLGATYEIGVKELRSKAWGGVEVLDFGRVQGGGERQ